MCSLGMNNVRGLSHASAQRELSRVHRALGVYMPQMANRVWPAAENGMFGRQISVAFFFSHSHAVDKLRSLEFLPVSIPCVGSPQGLPQVSRHPYGYMLLNTTGLCAQAPLVIIDYWTTHVGHSSHQALTHQSYSGCCAALSVVSLLVSSACFICPEFRDPATHLPALKARRM